MMLGEFGDMRDGYLESIVYAIHRNEFSEGEKQLLSYTHGRVSSKAQM